MSRIRDIEKAVDIANMFGQKTELRSKRFGVKFREISHKNNHHFKRRSVSSGVRMFCKLFQNSRLLSKRLLYKD